MEKVVLSDIDNEALWEKIIDKQFEHILIHQFNPNYTIDWWQTSIKINDALELNNISVRQMQFDLTTDLATLKKIIDLNTHYLSVYQFANPVPGTLILEQLPEHSKEAILKQNGLQHIIHISFEFISIESFNNEYLEDIRNAFSERLV